MAVIVIKDLTENMDLDREAMTAITGGARTAGGRHWQAHRRAQSAPDPVSGRLPGQARGVRTACRAGTGDREAAAQIGAIRPGIQSKAVAAKKSPPDNWRALVADGPDHLGQRRRRIPVIPVPSMFSHGSAHDADVHPDHPDSRRKPGIGINDRNAGGERQANLAEGESSGTMGVRPSGHGLLAL